MADGEAEGCMKPWSVLLAMCTVACLAGGRDIEQMDAPLTVSVDPARMERVATVDERYQSYNVEMLEVTGGKFWRPYGPDFDAIVKKRSSMPAGSPSDDTPAGMDPRLYQYRPPIDLANPRLRMLAAALGPAFVRVSGTWANTAYFAESDQPPTRPPRGFGAILTRQQWKGVIEFAKAVNAEIVAPFATGSGTRDAAGVWRPAEARRWFDDTRSVGGNIAAAEFMNEPTLAAMGGAPRGYDAVAYGRDFKIFDAFAREAVPRMLVLAPGSVGETTGSWGISYGNARTLATRDMLAASRPATVDAFSYHHSGASSLRCAAMGMQTTAMRRSPSNGSAVRKKRSPSTGDCAASSRRASGCG
jgi:heparanase